ncbi:MAG TPA: hypothetical protein VJ864_09995 [Candidatus Binatia bacterium]|nr:hypothetical protein [Candidatus Binatia bacterium]
MTSILATCTPSSVHGRASRPDCSVVMRATTAAALGRAETSSSMAGFVRSQGGHGHNAAAQYHVLGADPVFIEDAVIESGVQVNKTIGDRACPNARF